MQHPFSDIVKANDIRGVYPDDLDAGLARGIGLVVPDVLGASRVAVARDVRLSSPELYAALIQGLHDAGAETGRLGMCPTEYLYYALGQKEEFDLGIMITASHNPPEYNGLKLCGASAQPVGAPALKDLLRSVTRSDPEEVNTVETGEADRIGREYMNYARRHVDLPADVSDMDVVVDPGNGVAGVLWEHIEKSTGLEPRRMNFEPDGSFPAHLPDTSEPENLEALCGAVRESDARLGLAYDGDSDRVAVVTADGNIMPPDHVGFAVGTRLLENCDGGRMALSMAASRNVLGALRGCGHSPVLVPVGHSKVKSAMRRNPGVVFAAESSGHFYYRHFSCCDSSLLTTLHLLDLAARGKLQAAARRLQRGWRSPRSQPSFYYADPDEAHRACQRASHEMLGRYPCWEEIICERRGDIHRACSTGDIDAADGIRVDYEDWWFCVRPSGTEPKARLMLETRRPALLQTRLSELSALFQDGS
jgi:phosphomannomutase